MDRKTIWITTSVLLVYFIFTSGFVFEVTKSNAAGRTEIPYSIGLSAERAGLTTLATQDDMNCFEWFNKNWDGKTEIVGDYNTYMLITANIPAYFNLYYGNRSSSLTTPSDNCYIFVSSWNTKHKQYIEPPGIGLRASFPMPELNYPIAYQSGNAIIYRKEPPRK